MRALKVLVLSSVAVLPLSATAFAADAIQYEPVEPVAVEVMPQYSWAGGYTGLYLGYGWNKFKNNSDTYADQTSKPNNAKIGAYAGWNFQQDNIVYGIEGDAGYSWAKKTVDGLQSKQNFDGSLRARLGVDYDAIMPYITAGVAGSDIKLSTATDSQSKFRAGWTAGAGVEARLTDNVIGRFEYRYTDFGNKTYNLDTVSVRSKLQTHDIRVGVGYKF